MNALQRRIERMLHKLVPCAKTVSIVLEEGQEVPEQILASLNEHDRLIIHEIPKGYFGDEEDHETHSITAHHDNPPGTQNKRTSTIA